MNITLRLFGRFEVAELRVDFASLVGLAAASGATTNGFQRSSLPHRVAEGIAWITR